MVRSIETYHYDEDSLQKRTNKDEHACTEHDGCGDLLCHPQLRAPEHRNGYHDEVDIGEYTRDEGHPDNRLGDGTLAHIYEAVSRCWAARIQINLLPGSGLICQYLWSGRHAAYIVIIDARKVERTIPNPAQMRIRNFLLRPSCSPRINNDQKFTGLNVP